MRKTTKIFILSTLLLLFINGCNPSSEDEVNDDLFQFKNSYVGDSGAVGKIIMRLPNPNGEHTNGLELETTEEPYGIIVNYKNVEKTEELETDYKELALFNSTFILALVKNADWVKFNFVDQELKVTRQDLQNWYGKDLREFKTEEELTKFTQNYLEDENKVNQFFK